MLYLSTVLFLITQALAHDVPVGGNWHDFIQCNDADWAFANSNPVIYGAHRDGGADLVDYCYYGEFSGDENGNGNEWGFTYFNLLDQPSNNPHIDPFEIRVEMRIWAWGHWDASDRIRVEIYDQYQGPNSGSSKLDWPNAANYQRTRLLFEIGKRGNTCNPTNVLYQWNEEATNGSPDWYNEVPSTSHVIDVNCYTDISLPIIVESGVFGVRISTNMNDVLNNAGYAWSNMMIRSASIPPPPPGSDCCYGERNDNSEKSCGAFHESRNCLAKGCQWNVNDFGCQRRCCRHKDKRLKNKYDQQRCKSFNHPPNAININECQNRPECMITFCDEIGMGDNGKGKQPPAPAL